MAKSNELCHITLAVVCFAVSTVLFAPKGVLAARDLEDSIAPEPDEDEYSAIAEVPYPISYTNEVLPPEPAPGYYKFLEQCAKKINEKCSQEIFDGLFNGGTLSKPCCSELADMGRECHAGLVKVVITFNEFRPSASMALIRSEEIWNECASDTGSPSPF